MGDGTNTYGEATGRETSDSERRMAARQFGTNLHAAAAAFAAEGTPRFSVEYWGDERGDAVFGMDEVHPPEARRPEHVEGDGRARWDRTVPVPDVTVRLAVAPPEGFGVTIRREERVATALPAMMREMLWACGMMPDVRDGHGGEFRFDVADGTVELLRDGAEPGGEIAHVWEMGAFDAGPGPMDEAGCLVAAAADAAGWDVARTLRAVCDFIGEEMRNDAGLAGRLRAALEAAPGRRGDA